MLYWVGKKDFIQANYSIELPSPGSRVAVKIVDRLGEECVHVDGL